MSQEVEIDYTNWRGERRVRKVLPDEIAWDSTEWHGEAQWVLWAMDHEDGIRKAFAMTGIHSWKAAE